MHFTSVHLIYIQRSWDPQLFVCT